MLRILSRLVQEKQPSQMFRKFMLLADIFSGSQVFDLARDLFTLSTGMHVYSIKSKCKQYKVHTFRNPKNCITFALECRDEHPLKCYMTGFGVDIRKGDLMVIEDDKSSRTYRIESIDYYLDPPDLWMASLIEC
jgi:hypothetical protein